MEPFSVTPEKRARRNLPAAPSCDLPEFVVGTRHHQPGIGGEPAASIGLYDLDQVQDHVAFRAGRTGETYGGIGKYDRSG